MGRNVRVICLMLCLTVLVHMLIYQHENSWRRSYLIELNKSAISGGIGNKSHDAAANQTQPPHRNIAVPQGDGELYKLIDEHTAPFVENFPKQLIILGYQRVGSSFFGQIFDGNPSFFYVYEPLDSVYAEMYGTAGGFNVPSDIMYNAIGNPRVIPDEEKKAVRELLTNILGCNVNHLLPGFILNRYWYLLSEHYMPSWQPFRNCLKEHNLLKARETCWSHHLQDVCCHRFGQNLVKLATCRRKLRTSEPGDATPFTRYRQCMQVAYDAARPCLSIFRQKCEEARVWATKTVRGTMDEMSELLENNPNLRIIHLIRDPRPVAASRAMDNSYRGIYSGNLFVKKGGNKVHEAHVYCGTVVKDLQNRQQLQKAYPGKIAQVIYEDFVQNPTGYTKAVYKFLNEEIPKELMPWIHKHTQGMGQKNNATQRMNAWKSKLTFVEAESITRECGDFYGLLNYKWPYN